MRQQKEYLDRLKQLADKITQAHDNYQTSGDEDEGMKAVTLYRESYLPLLSEYMGYVRGRDER